MKETKLIIFCFMILCITLCNVSFKSEANSRNNSQRKLDSDTGEQENFILVTYSASTSYTDGFYRNVQSRDTIHGIFVIWDTKYGDNYEYLKDDVELEVGNGGTIRIVLAESLSSLKEFFENEANIKSVDFSHFDFSILKDMNSLFKGCSSLESVNFGEFDASKIEDMTSMFENCIKLTNLNISQFKTTETLLKVPNMFSGCSSLIYLDISSFNLEGVKKDETDEKVNFIDMFKGVDLKYISLNDGSKWNN